MNAQAARAAGPRLVAHTRVAPVTVIRFEEMVPDWGEYHESLREGNHRGIYRYIGGLPGRKLRAPLPGWEFSCGVVVAPPGNGAPLHDHHDEEIFMVWDGEFEVFWEAPRTKERESAVLGLYDAIRVPPGVMRGFRNAGKRDGFLHFIHGQGEYRYPVYHESEREGLPEGAPTAPAVPEPAYDPATQVIRHKEVPLNWGVYFETRRPGHRRGIQRYVGGISGERDEDGPPPALPDGEVGFSVAECGHGSGAPLHDHPHEEIFIPLEGKWIVYWLDERDEYRQALLGPWDACWVPSGVQRGYRSASRHGGKLHVIQGQGNSPPPLYAEDYSSFRG
ncbi:MAG: hypothetical protein HYZ11_01795 [Candidatus Tectomicrobia bacterium]|uniref:Cupin domain-containing protein n=1 Tax=Tectimicrobiota bacterium TaxID=2528274 RepID=A0A932HW35_UNCTE|nr:hypothetical protein [Candidatus Tectomicrobia bacterium]